jgi:hypothetical protein
MKRVKDLNGGMSEVEAFLQRAQELTARLDRPFDRKEGDDVFVTECPPTQFSEEGSVSSVAVRQRPSSGMAAHEVLTSGEDDSDLDLAELGLGVDPEVMEHASVEDLLDDAYDGKYEELHPEPEGVQGEGKKGEGKGGDDDGDEMLRRAAFRNYQEEMAEFDDAMSTMEFHQDEEDWHLKFRHGARRDVDDSVESDRIRDEIADEMYVKSELDRRLAMDEIELNDYLDREYRRNHG